MSNAPNAVSSHSSSQSLQNSGSSLAVTKESPLHSIRSDAAVPHKLIPATSLIRSPSHQTLDEIEAKNDRLGHENSGFLSKANGFSPKYLPWHELPASHKAWDDIAAQLSMHWDQQSLRKAAKLLPHLSIDNLDPKYFLRAESILGIVAHSYVRCSAAYPVTLADVPQSIMQPWAEVSRKLGRPGPHLSFLILDVYNVKLGEKSTQAIPLDPDSIKVGQAQLLVPTANSATESNFHLALSETIGAIAPFVYMAVVAQDAVVNRDDALLEQQLKQMLAPLQGMTDATMKINPNPKSKTHVDNIVWAKVAAPFSVALDDTLPGLAGAGASPAIHILDLFLGRKNFNTKLGAETHEIRENWYPQDWKDFLHSIEAVSVKDYVSQSAHKGVQKAWSDLENSYKTFLLKHRIKAFGYTQAGFSVGRRQTVAGFKNEKTEQIPPWIKTDKALVAAAEERGLEIDTLGNDTLPGKLQSKANVSTATLIQHNSISETPWLAIQDKVYDVSRYIKNGTHPGGPAVLGRATGKDSTEDFRRAGHFESGRVAAIMKNFDVVGTLTYKAFANSEIAGLYNNAIHLGYLLAELQNDFENDISIRNKSCSALDANTPQEITPLKLDLLKDTEHRFPGEYLARIQRTTSQIAQRLQTVPQSINTNKQTRSAVSTSALGGLFQKVSQFSGAVQNETLPDVNKALEQFKSLVEQFHDSIDSEPENRDFSKIAQKQAETMIQKSRDTLAGIKSQVAGLLNTIEGLPLQITPQTMAQSDYTTIVNHLASIAAQLNSAMTLV